MTPDSDLMRIGDEIEAYARSRIGPEDALDVRQDVLLKLVINQGHVQIGDEGRWAGHVAKNTVIDFARRRSRQALPAGDDLPVVIEPAAGPAAVTIRREDIRLVLAALDQLPPEQAQLLWEATVLEIPRDQLAAKYQVTPGALQARLTRARVALRKQFVAGGGSLGVFGVLFPMYHAVRPRLLIIAPGVVAAGVALLIGPWLPMPFTEDETPPSVTPITPHQGHKVVRPELPARATPEPPGLSSAAAPHAARPSKPSSPSAVTPVEPVVPAAKAGKVSYWGAHFEETHEEETFTETVKRCVRKGLIVSISEVRCRD